MTAHAQTSHTRPQITVSIPVRYAECDPMNVAHHSAYVIWLEIARTELLRQQGAPYRELEAQGILFVVARLSVRYKKPAYYDDILSVRCVAQPCSGVKVTHDYEIHRDTQLLATAQTTLACVDRQGALRPIPQAMRTS